MSLVELSGVTRDFGPETRVLRGINFGIPRQLDLWCYRIGRLGSGMPYPVDVIAGSLDARPRKAREVLWSFMRERKER